MKNISLNISGMTCQGCAKTVVRVLEAVNGVQSAAVDLAAERADIVFDEAQTNVSVLVNAVEDAGFDASA
ncbi:heavy-metal-associated domain-containing protein [Stenoxybacter acetivorans]|uniref:heavy-metal-associated domain-containing protein n=1 Tax=Stenoxybacter acetivorans TaxID=422441 RepID=UPI000562DCF3|nr:heavy metal-associated domain-containing protein [Stenoxybacter acetivorans]